MLNPTGPTFDCPTRHSAKALFMHRPAGRPALVDSNTLDSGTSLMLSITQPIASETDPHSATKAMHENATLASVGTPNLAVWRAGSPPGKCFTYSALQAS